MTGKYSKLFKPYVAYGKNDKGFYDIYAADSLKYFDDKVPKGDEWEALKDMGIDLNLPSTWHEIDTYFLTDNVLPFVTPDKKDWGKDTWFAENEEGRKERIANNIWHDFDNHKGKFSVEDFEKNGITPEARRRIFERLVLDARNNANHLDDYENREDKSEDYMNYGIGMRLSIDDALRHKKYLDSLEDGDSTEFRTPTGMYDVPAVMSKIFNNNMEISDERCKEMRRKSIEKMKNGWGETGIMKKKKKEEEQKQK